MKKCFAKERIIGLVDRQFDGTTPTKEIETEGPTGNEAL